MADAYGVGLPTFCAQALGIARSDGEARSFRNPTMDVLSRLSDGTGLTIDTLLAMRTQARLVQVMKELACSIKTEKGQRALDKYLGAIQPMSRNL